MAVVKELYSPTPMAANASVMVNGNNIGGFLAVASGTLTITDQQNNVLVNALPVTAGFYVPIPMLFRLAGGGTVQLAGGAAGTLFT